MASGTVTGWTEAGNGGWWDPGGYWYTNGTGLWVAEFVIPLPAGDAITSLSLAVDDGDLGGGMNHQIILVDGTVLADSGPTGQHGTNEYGGAASIGMHGVTSWSGVPATYLRSPVVRYRCAPPAGGNHYLFNSRVQMGWVSAPQPVLVMLL